MTNDDQSYEEATGPGEGAGAGPDAGEMDTTMAAGPRGGVGGVVNPGLGTSGAPAEDMLTPEELAQTEVTGGAGLDPNAISKEQLDGYLEEIDPTPGV
jgi:hypothetical protein